MYPGGSARDKAASLRIEAASLCEQAELRLQDAQLWEQGADGEVRVGRALAEVERHGWTALHDRLIRPGRDKANLDHLVIGPGGVVLVDSKNWAAGAWLYDGTLFRIGPTGPTPCRKVLAHIMRDAAAVAEKVGQPVTPMLCLSGPRAGKLRAPVEIGGVHVVFVDQLTTFLRTRPPTLRGDEVTAVTSRLDKAFPSACANPPGPATAPAADRSRPEPVARKRGALRVLFRGSLVFASLALLLFLPRISVALSHALASRLVSAAVPVQARFRSPCSAVTDADVAHAVGRPVYRLPAAASDTCRWSYTSSPSPYSPSDVTVVTGWMVKSRADAAHGVVKLGHDPLQESVLVPQSVAVPGSPAPATATTQPLGVSVRVVAGMPSSVAAAAVLRLAQLTQEHMPSGPGATTVEPGR